MTAATVPVSDMIYMRKSLRLEIISLIYILKTVFFMERLFGLGQVVRILISYSKD